MDGTKIMVLKLHEIIRTLVFALLGIALILIVIYFFVPKEKKEEQTPVSYNPGTYTATVSLTPGDITLEVTVSENQILDIQLKDLTEAHELFYPLLLPTLAQVSNEILTNQTLEIAFPTDSLVTGEVLLTAVGTALAQAVSP